ncbi:MAG: AzlD domain-containing protein [Thermoguttaceae bacterium]
MTLGRIYVYIFLMWFVTYLLRATPLLLIRKPLKNKFVRSFLYYTPYVTLAVMTFPAIIHATRTPYSGAIALVFGVVVAWFGWNLFQVAAACCALVFLTELFLL